MSERVSEWVSEEGVVKYSQPLSSIVLDVIHFDPPVCYMSPLLGPVRHLSAVP